MNNSRPSEEYKTEGLTEPLPGIPRTVESQNGRCVNKVAKRGHMNHPWEQEVKVLSLWILEGLYEERD
jgi:hypothetical protein